MVFKTNKTRRKCFLKITWIFGEWIAWTILVIICSAMIIFADQSAADFAPILSCQAVGDRRVISATANRRNVGDGEAEVRMR